MSTYRYHSQHPSRAFLGRKMMAISRSQVALEFDPLCTRSQERVACPTGSRILLSFVAVRRRNHLTVLLKLSGPHNVGGASKGSEDTRPWDALSFFTHSSLWIMSARVAFTDALTQKGLAPLSRRGAQLSSRGTAAGQLL